jgi:hypothetical protein
VTSGTAEKTRWRSFLVVPGRAFDFGIDTNQVAEVLADRQGSDRFGGQGAATDLADLLGMDTGNSANEARLLSIRTEGGAHMLRIFGSIAVRQVAPASICDLPRAVRRGKPGQILAGVVFESGQAPLLIVDLGRAWTSR